MKWQQTARWPVWWQTIAFPILRDIGAVGTGLYLIISQNQRPDPSTTIITAGLILVTPIAAIHGYQLLAGPSSTQPGAPPSSPPASSASSSLSQSSEPADEGGLPPRRSRRGRQEPGLLNRLHASGALAWTLAVLLVIGITLAGAEMAMSANAINRIRGDFCSWAQVHYQALQSQPRDAAREADAGSDVKLMRELGCTP